MADTALLPDDTLSPSQIAAANPAGIPQAVSQPGGKPENIVDLVSGNDARKQKAIADTEAAYNKYDTMLDASQQEGEDSDKKYADWMERRVKAEGVTADDWKPWNAEQELAKHKTDLWSQFGSPGFIIAMLGSAFTAQPMNSALSSGAAAMNAIHQGDMAAYEKSFRAWKENSDLVIKRLNLEHQQIADIDHLRISNLAEWRSKMEVLLQQFGDERKLALLRNGYFPDVDKAREAEIDLVPKLKSAQQAIILNRARFDILNGHIKQPGEVTTHKDASGNEMAGGDSRYYKGTDIIGATIDADSKIKYRMLQGEFGMGDAAFDGKDANKTPPYSESFGVRGEFNWLQRKAQDFLSGKSTEATQERTRATQDLEQLRFRTLSALSADVENPQRLKLIQERIEHLFPGVEDLFTGPTEAITRIKELRSDLTNQMQENMQIITSPTFDKKDQEKAKLRFIAEKNVVRDMDKILTGIAAGEGAETNKKRRFKGGDPSDPDNWEPVKDSSGG